MRTKKQIAASRENGRQSHGAATPEGKARIVAANLKSGVFANTQMVAWEEEAALQSLKDEYYARHPPASPATLNGACVRYSPPHLNLRQCRNRR